MATQSSILPWRIPWTEELTRYSPWGHGESDTTGTSQHALRQGTGNNRRFLTALEARNLRSRSSQDFFFSLPRLLSLACSGSSSCSHGVPPLCISVLIPSLKVASHTGLESVTF